MIIYQSFYKRFVLRRSSQLTKTLAKSELVELPKASVIHLLDDNFSFNKPVTFVPDLNNWGLNIKPRFKFMHHVKEPPPPTAVQYTEYFRLPAPGLNTAINNFRKSTLRFIKPIKDLMDMPTRNGVINYINYNPLFRARIFGIRRSTRRFNYIWSCVVNMLSKLPSTHMHYIPIPVGKTVYEKNEFLLSFKAYTRTSIKYPDDPWYLLMMNLLGYLHSKKTESIFENIPENLRANIHFILYGRSKMFIFNLSDMKKMNGDNDTIMVRFISTLNMLAEDSTEAPASDISEQINQSQFKGGGRDDIEETYEDDDKDFDESQDISEKPKHIVTISSPKEEVVEPTELTSIEVPELIQVVRLSNDFDKDTPAPKLKSTAKAKPTPIDPVLLPDLIVDTRQGLANKSFRQKTKVTSAEPDKPKEQEAPTILLPELETIDEINPAILEIDRTKGLNTHKRVRELADDELKKFSQDIINDIDKGAQAAIEAVSDRLTTAQKTRAKKLSEQYKHITFNNTPIIDILTDVPKDTVGSNSLDFLKDKVSDPSMLKSSIQSFDHDYINNYMQKDLITNLVSFNAHGMFLKEINSEDISDDLDRMVTYKVKYEDVHHKEHTIKFTLPKVDENGYCLVNGSTKILKKQRVVMPICKISNTRVTLNSDYNKFLVERNTSVAHSLINYVDRILSAAEPKTAIAIMNAMRFQKELLPYDYTALASKYIKIITKKDSVVTFYFNYPERFNWLKNEFNAMTVTIDAIKSIEDEIQGTFFGISRDKHVAMFMMLTGEVKIFNYRDETVVEKDITFIDLLCSLLDVTISRLSEWVDFKLLNKSVPLAFALCYRYGLNYMLNYTKTKYQVYRKNVRIVTKASDIVIPFADAKLVIPRSPLVNSLIFAGLNNFNLSKVEIEAMNTKDVYFELLQSKNISTHNLKGIDDYFELFIDPITKDVLFRMGEPTDPKDLLIRATQLLSTEDHQDPASESNYRYRSCERFNTAVYKSIARAYATYKNKSLGATNKMSISDYEVKQLIVQDQLMENAGIINPINDIKYKASYSHSGFGGRQSVDTFVLDDRQYPEDGVGSMSEATVDNMKTGYIASLSVDPVLANIRGMPKPVNTADLEPTQMLSISSCLVPCVTNDDGKRKLCAPLHQ